MNGKDVRFSQLHIVIDNQSHQLHKERVGITKKQAWTITLEEEIDFGKVE